MAEFAVDALVALGMRPGGLRVADPACGEGVFLDAARRRLPDAELWGCDLDASLEPAWSRAGLVEPQAHVFVHDGLTDAPWYGLASGTFDLAIGNPPYGLGVARPKAGEPIEALFLRRFVELAAKGGWVAVVVPEGILANARSQRLRDWLLRHVALEAVVGLPESTFAAAGTRARTALLLARKGGPSRGPVLLAEPTGEGVSSPRGHERRARGMGTSRPQRREAPLQAYLAGVLETLRS